MKRIAIFASGAGSNAIKLIEHFSSNGKIEVALVLSNKTDAPVLKRASEKGVDAIFRDNSFVADGKQMAELMREYQIDWIILAGYLRLIPEDLVNAFPRRMINVHPALLPKFGGKGMYGHHVHEAVIAAKEKESGITIHFVDAYFDEGAIIAQFHCPVDTNETAESLYRTKIQYLEHNYFPVVVEKTLLNPSYD